MPWTASYSIRHKLLVDFHLVGALDDAVLEGNVRRVETLDILLLLLVRQFILHAETALNLARIVVGVLADKAQIGSACAVVPRKEGLASG